ncbi:uncharacterized protein METZ01_LOCUS500122, partial [marine metagenome]
IEADKHGAMPPAVKNATFIEGFYQSCGSYKLLPSPYLDVSKFSKIMNTQFYHYISIILITLTWTNDTETKLIYPTCIICLQPLYNEFSVDVWGNAFHSKHEKEGLFCHSCSRIISQGVTRGGYVYSDGRHLCSLCKITAVNDDSTILTSYQKVIAQFEKVGILHIPKDIPIELVDLLQLNKKAGEMSHAKLKGFTIIDPISRKTNQTISPYNISILFGLPKIEFEAVLAHEFLH